MLPKAALIPPCAATVCDLVGNNLETQAVLKPSETKPKAAQTSTTGTNDNTVIFVVNDVVFLTHILGSIEILTLTFDPITWDLIEDEDNNLFVTAELFT